MSVRPELQQRLRALGVVKGTGALAILSRAGPRVAIEELVPGRFYTTSHGRCFIAESHYPPGHRHGQVSLPAYLHLCSVLTALHPRHNTPADKQHQACFLDIETTDLSGSSGTFAFVVGLGFFAPEQGEGFHLYQYFLRDPGDELAMLEALSEQLARFQALVSFNGRAFDVPVLENRFILARIPPPANTLFHLDLLPVARRLWRYEMSSCALGALERRVLGVLREQDDVPGSLIPWLYRDYLRTGDARQMKRVLYHNAMDILSMVALVIRLHSAITASWGEAGVSGAELYGLGRWHESEGRLAEAERYYCTALGASSAPELRWRILHSLASLLKRTGRYDEARPYWEQLAAEENTDITSCVELAKYFEWRAGDYVRAAEWARKAMVRAETWAGGTARDEALAELSHRLARLERKCAGSGTGR